MKVIMLYRPNSEFSRMVEDFARELERQHQTRIDLVNIDSRDGSSTASLYDIIQHPAILVLGTDGQLVKDWQGTEFPLMQEISYYTHI